MAPQVREAWRTTRDPGVQAVEAAAPGCTAGEGRSVPARGVPREGPDAHTGSRHRHVRVRRLRGDIVARGGGIGHRPVHQRRPEEVVAEAPQFYADLVGPPSAKKSPPLKWLSGPLIRLDQ